MTFRKVKTSAKIIKYNKKELIDLVLYTMKLIVDTVGSTFGPGGKNVIIESTLPGLPNINTKDGVTVFRHLGHIDPTCHLLIEQARDAAVRTASEAGDGTTTATILSEAIVRYMYLYCEKNPKVSPQKVMRNVREVVSKYIEPMLIEASQPVTVENQDMLEKVATISANGDKEMASAVIKAFNLVGFGENSHVTIQELNGPGGYEVELIDGYPVQIGYEDSCRNYYNGFINDRANNCCRLEKPVFLLYDGQVRDIGSIQMLLEAVGKAWQERDFNHNVILVAHGFSEQVLQDLMMNFMSKETINVFPLRTPMSQVANSQSHFLHDLAAFTGASILDPVHNKPSNVDNLEVLGLGISLFESYRFRSNIVGNPDADLIEIRAEEIEQNIKNAESEIEKTLLEERLGKLTKGIAKLKIFAATSGDLKERHDRCEDAVCAVRGSLRDGVLPGGCRMWLTLAKILQSSEEFPEEASFVLANSMLDTFNKMMSNAGYTEDEINEIAAKLFADDNLVYDVENQECGDAFDLGILDSTPAVVQAIRNAASIATILGTLGATICFPRDNDLERMESMENSQFLQQTQCSNPANERL